MDAIQAVDFFNSITPSNVIYEFCYIPDGNGSVKNMIIETTIYSFEEKGITRKNKLCQRYTESDIIELALREKEVIKQKEEIERQEKKKENLLREIEKAEQELAISKIRVEGRNKIQDVIENGYNLHYTFNIYSSADLIDQDAVERLAKRITEEINKTRRS